MPLVYVMLEKRRSGHSSDYMDATTTFTGEREILHRT